MLFKDTHEFTKLNSDFLSAVVAFFATTTVLYILGLHLIKVHSSRSIHLEVTRWEWLDQLDIDFEPSADTESWDVGPSVSWVQPQQADQVSQVIQPIQMEKSSLKKVRRTKHRTSSALSCSTVSSANTLQEKNEAKTMQVLHQALRRQFILAMDTHSGREHGKPRQRVQMVAAASSKAHEMQTVVSLAGLIPSRAPASVSIQVEAPQTQMDIKVHEASQKVDELLQIKQAWMSTQVDSFIGPPLPSEMLPREKELPQTADLGSQGVIGSQAFGVLASIPSRPSGVRSGGVLLSNNEYSSHRGHLQGRGYPVVPPFEKTLAMNTQIKRSDLVAFASLLSKSAEVSIQSESLSPLRKLQTALQSAKPEFREAFNSDQEVLGVQSTVMSLEGEGAGWRNYATEGYWPTVTRFRPHQSIPLISDNSAQLLGMAARARAQREAGIVFGSVPSGWSVAFAGHSEKGVFLNAENQTLSPFALEADRMFAFINAEPGARALILRGPAEDEYGVIAVPVLAGHATYVDLTRIDVKKLSGYVFDGDSQETPPLGGVQVRLSGTSSQDVVTDSNGYFEINHVLTLDDYPVYIETDQSGGFTHRYEVKPENFKEAVLYRLSDSQISNWVDQLEGGISPESGLAVIALSPSVLERALQRKLLPRLSSLMKSSSLTPETYSISPHGELQVQSPIDPQLPRFISVQLSEGPFVAEVVDERDQPIWSNILFAQPRIVNIVGP